MRVFVLYPRYSYPTRSGLSWSTERSGQLVGLDFEGWNPFRDVEFVSGGNTWSASGNPTDESLARLSSFWGNARGAKAPLNQSHVIGDFGSSPKVDVIVDEQFMASSQKLSEDALGFTEFSNVWDVFADTRPWDGPCYLACVKELRPTYDLDKSELIRQSGVIPRLEGAYISNGSKRIVRASSVMDAGPIWRAEYTREVFCNQDFISLLSDLGVSEWSTREIQVLNDLN